MNRENFFQQMNARIAKHDLLCHPFYLAWSAGELTRDDLKEYAQDYFHHVDAFPTYLAELADRLDDGELRRELLANMADEEGTDGARCSHAAKHSDLWRDFAEGMGSHRELQAHIPIREMSELTSYFHGVAAAGTPEEALAAFYAYESQAPRIAKEKARGLQVQYGADEHTCAYFTLHVTADVYHSQVWQEQLWQRIEPLPQAAETALDAAENAARMLWRALDGVERRRTQKQAA